MNNPDVLSWETDLKPFAPKHNGLKIALEQTQTHEDLIRLLGQYVHFNAHFGACVAHLASSIAVGHSFLREKSESVHELSDRSAEIAAHIFAAAIDEFGGDAKEPISHRLLAQRALRSVGQFFGYDGEALNKLIEPNKITAAARKKVLQGYGADPDKHQNSLAAVGFHVGSEMLAGDEFRTIDQFLRTSHPHLVNFMQQKDPAIGNAQAYTWIKIHTIVEDEHAEHAVKAANLMLRYGRDRNGPPLFSKKPIIEGFQQFAKLQKTFLRHIAD